MTKRVGPIYNRRTKLGDAPRRILSRLVADRGVAGAATVLKCSAHSVEELVTGGSCLPRTTERLTAALEALGA